MRKILQALKCLFLNGAAVLLMAATQPEETTDPVLIESGYLTGTVSGDLHIYKGIPYAAPPTGDRRFEAPARPIPWDTPPRAATDFGPICPQPKIEAYPIDAPQSEDCLTLNIWAPTSGKGPYPVMVWIHGGGFIFGHGGTPAYDGTHLAQQGVIVVTLNYRVGPLGFMASPDQTVGIVNQPLANFGLADQIAALEWISRNIGSFNGDKHNVTIFGESAGGASVNYLMVSPKSKGLFHRAIAQSGYGMTPMRHSSELRFGLAPASNVTRNLLEKLRIPNDENAMTALKSVPLQKFMRAAGANLRQFAPMIDSVILLDEPGQMFGRGEQHDVSYLSGGNSLEGHRLREQMGIKTDFVKSFKGHTKTLRALYADDYKVSEALGADRVFGDSRYLVSAHYLTRQMSQKSSNAYRYFFDHIVARNRSTLAGALHASEIPFVFGTLHKTVGEENVDKRDRNISRLMTRYWVNFAKTGNPNGEDLPEWPAIDRTAKTLVLSVSGAKPHHQHMQDKMAVFEADYVRRWATQ